jgi:3-isopropylmalate/(R)-2-methylmalate dehydratase small subunit
VDAIEAREEITIDFDKGEITTPRGTFSFPKYPDFVRGLIEDGGLIPHVKKSLGLE